MPGMSAIAIVPDTFAITVAFIALATFAAAFVRGRKKDKCLRNFEKAPVTLQLADNKLIWGRLTVENTGLELTYDNKHADQQGHTEASFILYKHEFGDICALVRFFDDLDDREKYRREKDLKRTWHPGPLSRWRRRLANIFRTVRDSIMEVANLLLARAQKTAHVGQVLTTQDKYVSRIKTELTGAAGMSYEPLLERHIGRKVVFEMARGDKLVEYSAVLKEYTTEFIELMDVYYGVDDLAPRRGDIIVPRSRAIVRHLGE